MEDYRLPAPLIGMLWAIMLGTTGQTDLQATKLIVIVLGLARSVPKKLKTQPSKNYTFTPSTTSAKTKPSPSKPAKKSIIKAAPKLVTAQAVHSCSQADAADISSATDTEYASTTTCVTGAAYDHESRKSANETGSA